MSGGGEQLHRDDVRRLTDEGRERLLARGSGITRYLVVVGRHDGDGGCAGVESAQLGSTAVEAAVRRVGFYFQLRREGEWFVIGARALGDHAVLPVSECEREVAEMVEAWDGVPGVFGLPTSWEADEVRASRANARPVPEVES